MGKRFKELFDMIPSPDDLYLLGIEGLKAEIILVDVETDKKLSILNQLSAAQVKGPNSNPASIIKKIAGLVSDFYRRPNLELSPAKSALEGISQLQENKGIQLLGQIWHGSCHPRAILFKVLADAAGLESKLMVGLPNDAIEYADSYRHLSVVVLLKSVEHLVDLMRFPFSTRAIVMSHISTAGETDSAENDSCDSPLEPNNPLYGFSERLDSDGAVRAMNELLKQNCFLRDQVNEGSISYSDDKGNCGDPWKDETNYHVDGQDQIRATYGHAGTQMNSSQKAISLPSFPHEFRAQSSGRIGASGLLTTKDVVTIWNKVLESSPKPLLPYEEWNIDFSELTVGTRVGIGFFGEVFRGIWNGIDIAIKVFLVHDLTAENMENFCNEISILSRLRHPNVILFLGACMKPPKLSMVTEYMEMGSLYYLIHTTGQKKLSWRRRLKMLRDICRGLMCIHRMKIVHRDLKSANCLVNKHWMVKISDFGLSRVMVDRPMRNSSSAGTPEWMAPELIRNEPFTEKCDIFSFGVIMWELCTLRRPWDGVTPVQVIHAVANERLRLKIPDGPLGKLISDCWGEPDERPSCQEILSRLLDCESTLC